MNVLCVRPESVPSTNKCDEKGLITGVEGNHLTEVVASTKHNGLSCWAVCSSRANPLTPPFGTNNLYLSFFCQRSSSWWLTEAGGRKKLLLHDVERQCGQGSSRLSIIRGIDYSPRYFAATGVPPHATAPHSYPLPPFSFEITYLKVVANV